MFYNANNTINYFKERNSNISNPQNLLYDALKEGGINTGTLPIIKEYPFVTFNASWNEDSTLDDFVSFFGSILGINKVSLNSDEKISITLSPGDVLVKKDFNKNEWVMWYLVTNVDNNYKTQVKYELVNNEDTLEVSFEYLDENDLYLLRFSQINYNFSNYYNLIFKNLLFDNKYLLTRLLLLCCSEARNLDGSIRKNALTVFSQNEYLEMQNEIEYAITSNRRSLDFDKKILISFLNKLCSGKDDELDFNNRDEVIKNKKIGINSNKKNEQLFFDGKLPVYVQRFFENKSNRKIFQERFTVVFQYYLLLELNLNEKQYIDLLHFNDNPEVFDGSENEIREYCTLSKNYFAYITQVIRYFSNEYCLDVDSLFALSGYIFDSVILTSDERRNNLVEEFERYKELVNCYGRMTLDYFFALKRYKDVNHYVAEELSEIYFYGAVYEGYTIEPNRDETISLLNTCKDYSLSARWSLAENWKHVAEMCEELEKKYKNENDIIEDIKIYKTTNIYPKGIKDIVRITKKPYSEILNEGNASNNLAYLKICTEREKIVANDLSEGYYKSCGNYPPALNSIGKLYREKIQKQLNQGLSIEDNDVKENIIKMIQYYTKSARFGWVYAFNNLYAVLSNKEIEHIKNDVKVRKTLKEAYDVLTTDEIISSEVDARRNNEEEFIAIKKKLVKGTTENLKDYKNENLSLEFKYSYPIEQPINFLVVSAYFGNLYGMNHLGLEYVKSRSYYGMEKARKLFESAALYGPWGYYNLAMNIYNNIPKDKVELLLIAANKWQHKESKEKLTEMNVIY